MRKKFAKLLSVILVSATFLCGCGGNGGNGNQDSDQQLDIYLLEQGYGSDWCRDLIDEFKKQDWVKEKYPELEVTFFTNDVREWAFNNITLTKSNKYDIMFGNQLNSFAGQDDILLELTDLVYNAKVPGEDVTFKEKLNDSYVEYYTYTNPSSGEETFYSVPYYTGIYGFIYNEDALTSYGLEVPRTTDEFIKACETIRNANLDKYKNNDPAAQYCFIQSKEAAYWQMDGGVLSPWWAQYEGVEGYNNFYNGIVNGERSVDIFKQQGRLESLKVIEELLDYNNQYVSPQSFNQEYMISQTAFLQGAAVFHYNGDYFTDEMKDVKQRLENNNYKIPVIKMMKNPIISSIKNKCTTIADDAELSALVKAIDAGSRELKGDGYEVNQKDFNKVFEARRIVNGSLTAPGVIPSYAKGKGVAVDFLRFMATDAGISAYCKGASGATIAFDFDPKTYDKTLYDSLEPLQQGRIDYMCNKNDPVSILKSSGLFPLCNYGKVDAFIDMKYYTMLSSQNKRKTAQNFYDETIEYWTQNTWQTAISKAGLL